METSTDYIRIRLDDVAQKHYKENSKAFYDFNDYRVCLDECYALIARKECEVLEKEGCDFFWMSYEDFQSKKWHGDFSCFHGKFLNINRNEFLNLFPIRRDGKKTWRIPYSDLLDALVDENIIIRNDHYKKGEYSKSFLLHHDFVYDVVGFYLMNKKPYEDVDIFQCFNAHPSRRDVLNTLKDVKKVYKGRLEKNGLTVRLPLNWHEESGIDEWGRFGFDTEGMTVFELERGIHFFKKHTSGCYSAGRFLSGFMIG